MSVIVASNSTKVQRTLRGQSVIPSVSFYMAQRLFRRTRKQFEDELRARIPITPTTEKVERVGNMIKSDGLLTENPGICMGNTATKLSPELHISVLGIIMLPYVKCKLTAY